MFRLVELFGGRALDGMFKFKLKRLNLKEWSKMTIRRWRGVILRPFANRRSCRLPFEPMAWRQSDLFSIFWISVCCCFLVVCFPSGLSWWPDDSHVSDCSSLSMKSLSRKLSPLTKTILQASPRGLPSRPGFDSLLQLTIFPLSSTSRKISRLLQFGKSHPWAKLMAKSYLSSEIGYHKWLHISNMTVSLRFGYLLCYERTHPTIWWLSSWLKVWCWGLLRKHGSYICNRWCC